MVTTPQHQHHIREEDSDWILQQLKVIFAEAPNITEEYQYRKLVEKMEYRHFNQPNEPICTLGDNTTPALYVVCDGKALMQQNAASKAASVPTFGFELLASAQFRKTKSGKLIQSLVAAPYR